MSNHFDTLCYGLTVHNHKSTMVAFASSSASTLITVSRSTDGTVNQVEREVAVEMLNSLTADGFDYMLSHGRTLQALCEIGRAALRVRV